MEWSPIENEVIDVILEAVNLNHIEKDNLTKDTILMGDELGLDSVDVLEIVVAVEHAFGIKLSSADEGKKVFQTIGSIANYIESNK